MHQTEDLTARYAHLSPTKRALLEKWKRGELAGTGASQAIPRRSQFSPAPLSFAQQRLWFLDQLLSDTSAYNLHLAVRLSGPLDPAALEQSLNAIVQRHEILRITFSVIEGQPVQVIAPTLAIALPVEDLRHISNDARQAEIERCGGEELHWRFDLSRGPLLRAKLLQLAETDHVLFLTLHHIVGDMWSFEVLERELSVLYQAHVAGRPAPLPDLPIQYADFAAWQPGWLSSDGRLEAQLAYWKKHLGDSPPVLELPTDRPRPIIQAFRGAREYFEIGPALSQALRELSQREEATLFMTLLSAFQILLGRYSRQDDILVGTPIANRGRVELEGLIGFFANTLVLRADLSGDPSCREFLRRVREATLGAYAHQDIPFEKLVDELQPVRDMSRNPLFQVMFVLQNVPVASVDLTSELKLTFLKTRSQTSIFDLWLQIEERSDKLLGTLEYNTDLFDAATIERMIEHFQIMLASMAADPEQSIWDVPLLSETERQRLLVEWNATQTPYPDDERLHQLVESQAAQTPDRVAVVFDGADDSPPQHITFHELDRRADLLAHHLSELGVGPDVGVGICTERSVELVIGLLGILKAGGAYLPLDPAYPRERLAFMLDDARVPVVLTQRKLLADLPPHDAHTLCLDADWVSNLQPLPRPRSRGARDGATSSLSRDPARAERGTGQLPPSPDNLAYLIYTSGSTGLPKGAMNTHRGICNRLRWMQSAYHLTESDRVLQKTPFSFDVSVWEFFWPLLTGACLVMARPEGHKDAGYLVETIRDQHITTLHFVPSMLGVFLDEPGLESLRALKRVICSGEALPFEFQERFFARLKVELHNLYGPTEAAVDVTFWACPRDGARSIVPIGRPIANSQIYILDSRLRPVPIGVPGELHIGGVGLARGYLNRPELTAERFVPPPPFPPPSPTAGDTEGGHRLYKTGDLARWLPDGNIEYLGRLDFQVKIRGFRIELGEIEAALRGHPAVQDAVVSTWESDDGPASSSRLDRRLAAYIVANPHPAGAPNVEAQLAVEQVSQWQMVFDDTYHEAERPADSMFNIAGWNSSYTGQPLPPEDMREWVEGTVARIATLKPRRVLEIGCGTGLQLLRLAPGCERYWGTDISAIALRELQAQVEERGLAHVQLMQRSADDFAGIAPGDFDTVILNSVVQYFPNLDYLARVLKRAVEAVSPGGRVFIGDVRNLPLLETFHASVELHHAPASLSLRHLRRRIRQRVAHEEELVIDPAFFFVLAGQLPTISRVEVQLKRGRRHNELTCFRYDVMLHVGSAVTPATDIPVFDWREEQLNLSSLRQMLIETKPDRLGLWRVPNARLIDEASSLAALTHREDLETVEDLQRALGERRADSGVDPEDVWALGDELAYAVDIRWSDSAADCFDAIFHRIGGETSAAILPWPIATSQPWSAYANNPLLEKQARQLTPELRRYLKEKLPEHMTPAAFVLLAALPLTPNGKVDRQALPAPVQVAPEIDEDFVAPRTPMEKTLADIWAEVLGLEQVGVTHNFFGLGGDSIRSIQVIGRARQAGLRLTPKQMFQHQTIAELVVAAERAADESAEWQSEIGPALMTPFQHRFFEAPGHGAQSRLLEIAPDVYAASIEEALKQLASLHDALRLRFAHSESGWTARIAALDEIAPLAQLDLSALSEEQQRAVIEARVAETQAGLGNVAGPLFQAVYFDLGRERAGRLLLAAHRLVMDDAAWSIVLADLQMACEQLGRGGRVTLPAKTFSFRQWAQRLAELARSDQIRQEQTYWLADERARTVQPPVDFAEKVDRAEAALRTISVPLTPEETEDVLQRAPMAYHLSVEELLLTALAQAWLKRIGAPSFVVECEFNAREDAEEGIDLSRTAGCFDYGFPTLLALDTAATPGEAIKSIKEQLRQTPNRGLGYGLLRYLGPDAATAERLRALPEAKVRFRYRAATAHAPASALFRPIDVQAESSPAMGDRRSEQVAIEAGVTDGQMALTWTYDERVYRRDTIDALAHGTLAELRSLTAHCLSPEAGGYTPSDFLLAQLDQPALDRLIEPGRQVEDIYPLTPLQEHMLARYLTRPESGMYVWQGITVYPGMKDFDESLFRTALEWVVNRHPALRATFVWEGLPRPLQVIHPRGKVGFEFQDWRGLSPVEQEERLATYLEADRARGFDLAEPMVFRISMARLSNDAVQSVFTGHYMRLDGWSMDTLGWDCYTYYTTLVNGQKIQMPTYRPYREFVAWHQKQNQVEPERFWQKTLEGFNAPTPLTVHAPGNSPPKETGLSRRHLYLSLSTSTALQALVRQHHLTLNTLIQGAWALLLSHYTRRPDVLFGVVVAGRPPNLIGSEDMVGSFINALPLRVQTSPDDALLAWLKALMARQMEMSQYEYTPLLKIRDWCDVPRDQLLFESFLVYQSLWKNIFGNRTAHMMYAQWECPLRLDAYPQSEIGLVMCYKRQCFDAASVGRMLNHLRLILEGMVAAPEQRLGELVQRLD